jgi:hypothetical protein
VFCSQELSILKNGCTHFKFIEFVRNCQNKNGVTHFKFKSRRVCSYNLQNQFGVTHFDFKIPISSYATIVKCLETTQVCRLNWNVGVVTFFGADVVKLAGLQQACISEVLLTDGISAFCVQVLRDKTRGKYVRPKQPLWQFLGFPNRKAHADWRRHHAFTFAALEGLSIWATEQSAFDFGLDPRSEELVAGNLTCCGLL